RKMMGRRHLYRWSESASKWTCRVSRRRPIVCATWTRPQSCRVEDRARLVRARRGRVLIAGLIALLGLAALGFIDRGARVADHWGRGEMPVINVSYSDAKQYIGWLSQLTGKEYRFLTEAEWEYAARAGGRSRYSWGDDLGMGHANCDGCGRPWDLQQTAPAGSFKPNALGLYDMHGNLWERVEDSWHETYDGAPTDGSAWLRDGDPSYRVVRGGSWRNDGELVRTAVRVRRNINVRFDTLGFRVARTLRR